MLCRSSKSYCSEALIMYYHFSIERHDGFFLANCCELPDCEVQEKNIKDLNEKMYDKLFDYLFTKTKRIYLPEQHPELFSGHIQNIKIEDSMAFGVLLRYTREKNNLSVQSTAEKLGYECVWEYQKLEHKSDPSLSLIKKIIRVFPDFPINYLFKR